MNAHVAKTRGFEFYFPRLDTLVLVEDEGEIIAIRATRDTFSEPRKLAFIRELAAEGFIPEQFRWHSQLDLDANSKLRWVVDYSWLTLNKELAARARRFVVGLFLSASVLWLALMGSVLAW